MNIKSYKKLVSFYNSLLDKKFDKYLLSINKLNIIRSHFNYINYNMNYKESFSFLKIFKYFFLKKKIIKKKKKYLFLSTYVNNKKILEDDFYFSHIIKNISKKNFFVIYRNFKSINIDKKNQNMTFLSSKRFFLRDVTNLCKIVFKLINLKISFFFNKYKSQKINELISINSIKGALFNLSVVDEIINIINTIEPQKVFISFEGYSFERLLIHKLKQRKNTLIYAYYFSIISKYQNYPLRFKNNKLNPDFIITSGEVAKNKIYKHGFDKKKIINIGSNKTSAKLIKISSQKKLNVLLLPEAFENEVKFLIDFACKCRKYFNVPFILRLHPSFEINNETQNKIKELILEKNFVLSNKDLSFDLKRCSIAIYRGSGSIIEAINNNVYPVYLKKNDELSIDPLYEIEKIKYNTNSPKDFVKFYQNFSFKKINSNSFVKVKKYSLKYFEKPNKKEIKRMLSN